MSFRNDHDAALARAEALEQELEAEREAAAAQRKQLEEERAERRRLEAKLDAAKRDRSSPMPVKDEPESYAATDGAEGSMLLIVAAIIALFAFVIILERVAG